MKLRTALLGTVATALLIPQTPAPAFAQDARLEEITVTAQRREESLQDVPVAVSAFTSEAIERLNARDIRDLSGQVPNFVLNEVNIGPGMTQISLRGVNSQDPEKSFDPAVGVFIDGVYLGTSAFNLLDTFDLARMEILRGPQGTLFGRNTTGGAVNAERSRATGEFGAKGSALVGTDGRNDFKVVLNSETYADTVAFKLSGYSQNDDGLWDNDVGDVTGEKDRWAVNAEARFTPNDALDVSIIYDHAEDNSQLTPYVPRGINYTEALPILIPVQTLPTSPATVFPAFGPDPLCTLGIACLTDDFSRSTQNGPHEMNAKLDAVTVNGTYQADDEHEVTFILGWRDSEEDVYIDFDGAPVDAFHVLRVQEYEQYSAEVRVASQYDGPFNFVAGAFYFQSEYELKQAIDLDLSMAGVAVPFGVLQAQGSGDEDQHEASTYAVFAQGDYDVTEDVTVTFGLRATWDEKDIASQFKAAPFGTTPTLYQIQDGIPANRANTSTAAASDDWFEITPKLGVNWRVSDDTLLYASYSRGFNAGGFNARGGDQAVVEAGFDPEYIDAYEIGVKADLLDGRMRLNSALFYNDYKDKQEELIIPGPPPSFTSTSVANAAAARIMGVEFELEALITDEFRVLGSLGLMDAEYQNYPNSLASGNYVSTPAQPTGTLITADFSSVEMRRAPEITAAISPTYEMQVGEGMLTVSATGRYFDTQQTQAFGSPRGKLASEVYVDAFAQYAFGGDDMDRYVIKVFGKNLTDEGNGGSFVNSLVDFTTASLPPQYGVELLVNF